MLEIWHNPNCSKSRQTLALLEERGLEVSIVLYLDNPPSKERIRSVMYMLGGEPIDLVRQREELFMKLELAGASEQTLLEALADNPVLIQRPVVITEKGARIGRPPERVLEIL